MSANDLDGEVSSGCPQLVSDIILSSADLVVNSTSRETGTVVAASCRTGFILQGNPIVTCIKGGWNHPTPTCTAASSEPSAEPEAYGLPERDIIVIAVCCGVVVLILLGLIISIILYRRLHKASADRSGYPTLRSNRGQYPPYSYNWYLQHGLQSSASVASAPPSGYFLPQGEKSEFKDRINALNDPVYSVMWDPDKMEWHDSFDYSSVKSIPRPKVNSTSLEQWAFPYNYTN